MHINTLLYWKQHRSDLLRNMGLNTQMLDDIWIELHNARDAGYFNNKREATAEAFTKITSLLKLRYTTRDTRTAELGVNRKQQQAEVRRLVEKYSKQGVLDHDQGCVLGLVAEARELAGRGGKSGDYGS